MKKVLFAVMLFVVFLTNVVAVSKWDTKYIEMGETSKGILKEIKKESNNLTMFYVSEIIYTIPSNYKEDEIIINVGQDLIEALDDKTYLPGDASGCKISIKSENKYLYTYKDLSFFVSTENYNKYYMSNQANKLSGNIIIFDKNILPREYTHLRVKNSAIQNLYGVTNSVKDDDLKDDKLNEVLIKKGYKGISELNKYFLDFYNEKYLKNETKLEDFSNNIIREMFSGSVNQNKIYETNYELAELGYNLFYNHILSIVPKKITNYSDAYSIGTLMRLYNNNQASIFEKELKENYYHIKNNGIKNSIEFVMNINGEDYSNIYQDYNFGFTLGLKLIVEKEKVVINYSDENNNLLLENDTLKGKSLDSFENKANEFTNYSLFRTIDNVQDNFDLIDKKVIYIYHPKSKKDVLIINEINPAKTGLENNFFYSIVILLPLSFLIIKKMVK